MKIVDTEVQKEDFKTLFIEEFIGFKKYVERVQNQHSSEAMRLKILLPETRVCAWTSQIANARHKTKSNRRIGTPHT